jgi:2-amino-4-hydroxy-6-hydroxymethyldihydropteridine diphosphokinase
MGVWWPAYIGVGSNMEEPLAQIQLAIDALRALPRASLRVISVSPFYGSKPMGSIAQPDFVNGAVGVLTQLAPQVLLQTLKAIETKLGRPAKYEKWGPRVIDLDVLVYCHERRTDPELTLPHPGIVERNFVLYPLADIAPDLEVPGLGRVAELKGRLAPTGLWPL